MDSVGLGSEKLAISPGKKANRRSIMDSVGLWSEKLAISPRKKANRRSIMHPVGLGSKNLVSDPRESTNKDESLPFGKGWLSAQKERKEKYDDKHEWIQCIKRNSRNDRLIWGRFVSGFCHFNGRI